MASTVVKHTYLLKGGNEKVLQETNPPLLRREPIVVFIQDEDGNIIGTKMKIGDGVRNYNDLPFVSADNSSSSAIKIRIGEDGELYEADSNNIITIPKINIDIDDTLSLSSANPVQNKVITKEIYSLSTSLEKYVDTKIEESSDFGEV